MRPESALCYLSTNQRFNELTKAGTKSIIAVLHRGRCQISCGIWLPPDATVSQRRAFSPVEMAAFLFPP